MIQTPAPLPQLPPLADPNFIVERVQESVMLLLVLSYWRSKARVWYGASALLLATCLLPVSGLVLFEAQATSTVANSFAYLAMFNSAVFDRLLALFCPRVQGGQFDLSNRFVDKVPVPDLSNAESTDADTSAALVDMGRRIHAGREVELDHLENLVARTYRIPVTVVR